MADRKLVTVERIVETRPIEGADRIEVAKVRNWNVVVGKGDFQEGDLVAFFEIDSALPVENPTYAKFAERGVKTAEDGTKVHVLRTVKLRGEYSQGLIMGLDEVLDYPEAFIEGDDITDFLGIRKWEPPVKGAGAPKGSFPYECADKTDSERAQNLSLKQWTEISNHFWYPTEKLDGTSVTASRTPDGELIVASRNWRVGEESLHYKAVVSTGLDKLIPVGYTVQGEIVGPGIQGNHLQFDEVKIFLFTIWDENRNIVPAVRWTGWALNRKVPELTNLSFPSTIEEAIAQADGLTSQINPKKQAEGIVWHTISGNKVTSLGRNTFKVINNKWLSKVKD